MNIKEEFVLELRSCIELIKDRQIIADYLQKQRSTINQWIREDCTKWAGVETATNLLPLLKELKNNYISKNNIKEQVVNKVGVISQEHHPVTTVTQAFAKATNTNIQHVKRIPLQLHLIKEEEKTITTLKTLYSERIGKIDEQVNVTLNEYFMYLQNSRSDWFDWAYKGIEITARKCTVDQRGVAYLVGIYKSWLQYGFGTFLSEQTREILEVFKERFNINPSPPAVRMINQMVHDYGIVKAVNAILNTNTPTETDISLLITKETEKYLRENSKKIGVQ